MEFGELLKQFLIDLQSLFRTSTKKLNVTLSQITLISSIPIDGINMSTLSHRIGVDNSCLLYTSPSPRDMRRSRMPSSA